MKQILTALLLITSIMNMHSQIDSTIFISQDQVSQAEHLVAKYSTKITDAFTEGIQSVTPMAEDAFEMVVRLQTAKGVGLLLPIPLFFTFLLLLINEIKSVRKLIKEGNYHYTSPWSENNISMQMILFLILAVITGILSFITTYDGILHIMAPEWYAIKEIMGLFIK